jgi:hypothetical protein
VSASHRHPGRCVSVCVYVCVWCALSFISLLTALRTHAPVDFRQAGIMSPRRRGDEDDEDEAAQLRAPSPRTDALESTGLLSPAAPGTGFGGADARPEAVAARRRRGGGMVDEHALTPRQAIRAYPWAIFWTLAVSMTVIMEGVRVLGSLADGIAGLISLSCRVVLMQHPRGSGVGSLASRRDSVFIPC